MQDVSDNFLASLHGSLQPVFQVDAWYDSDLVLEDLSIVSGSVTLDSTRTIEGTLDGLVVTAEDGSIIPTRWDSPLACYGSQLHVKAGLQNRGGTEWLSLGWFRNNTYSVDDERWRPYQRFSNTLGDLLGTGLYPSAETIPDFALYPGAGSLGDLVGDRIWVCTGSRVSVSGSDLMALIDDDAFAAPQQPSQLGSVIAEIKFLASGLVNLTDLDGVPDAPIPRTFTYSNSRSQAIIALANLLGYAARMSPDGALELVPLTGNAPVWELSVDPFKPPLFAFARSGDRTGMHNGWVSIGSSLDGTPLQGSVQLDGGPLRWDGPFGRVPTSSTNAQLTTPFAAQLDASKNLASEAAGRTAVIPVTCPPNYALRTLDPITLILPDRSIPATVQALTWQLLPAPMTLQLRIDRDDLWGTV